MNIVTLNQHPSPIQHEFLSTTLVANDAIVVTSTTISLAYKSKPFDTLAYVRSSDLAQCGGTAHPSWISISDQQWTELLTTASKHIAW